MFLDKANNLIRFTADEYTWWKKLIYPHIDLPLMAIDEFRSEQDENPLFKALADICEKNYNVCVKKQKSICWMIIRFKKGNR